MADPYRLDFAVLMFRSHNLVGPYFANSFVRDWNTLNRIMSSKEKKDAADVIRALCILSVAGAATGKLLSVWTSSEGIARYLALAFSSGAVIAAAIFYSRWKKWNDNRF